MKANRVMNYLEHLWDNFSDLMDRSVGYFICVFVLFVGVGIVLINLAPALFAILIVLFVIGRVLFGIFTGK